MIRRRYRCPECSHEFDYDHHPSIEADPVPRYCARCGYDTEGGDMDPAVTMPMIGTLKGKMGDMYYREMERGADHRAALAQEHFGADTAEANLLKITDMKDNARAGEASVVPVVNDVSRMMDAAPQVTGFQSNGVEYSGAVASGPFPNAGARAQAGLRSAHAQFLSGSGHKGAVVSDLPALETQQPGYRRRV